MVGLRENTSSRITFRVEISSSSCEDLEKNKDAIPAAASLFNKYKHCFLTLMDRVLSGGRVYHSLTMVGNGMGARKAALIVQWSPLCVASGIVHEMGCVLIDALHGFGGGGGGGGGGV